MIPVLINDNDNFQIVRDKIAVILVTEIANQQALATLAGKDPLNFYARVYTERSRAFEEFLNVPVADNSALINVSFDSTNFDRSVGSVVSRQRSSAIYNIDCYGYASAEDELGSGHAPGDMLSNFKVQQAIRLVRNILMASEYVTLGMTGVVSTRWINTVNVFQPIIDNNPIQNVIGARVSFSVEFNEFAPQAQPVTLNDIFVGVRRALDGQILIEASYDFN
jgi:hypothetical protein